MPENKIITDIDFGTASDIFRDVFEVSKDGAEAMRAAFQFLEPSYRAAKEQEPVAWRMRDALPGAEWYATVDKDLIEQMVELGGYEIDSLYVSPQTEIPSVSVQSLMELAREDCYSDYWTGVEWESAADGDFVRWSEIQKLIAQSASGV